MGGSPPSSDDTGARQSGAAGSPGNPAGRSVPPYVPAPPPGVAVQLPGRAQPPAPSPGSPGQPGHGQVSSPNSRGPDSTLPPAPGRLTRSDELLNTGGRTVFEFDGRHAADDARPGPGHQTFAPGSFELTADHAMGRGESNLQSGTSTWLLLGVAVVVIGATWTIAALRPDPPPVVEPAPAKAAVSSVPDANPAVVAPTGAAADGKADAADGDAKASEGAAAQEPPKAEPKSEPPKPEPKVEPKAEPKPKAKPKPKPKRKKKVVIKPKKPPRDPSSDFDGLPKPPS